jgi:Ca-activated chloride channel family protein
MTEKNIALKLTADTILVKKSVPTRRIIEVALKAPELTDAIKRPPLNLALVLDRSGSMGGEKLEDAKYAAIQIVELLSDIDHLSVVLFDDEVDLLVASQPATPENKREIIQTLACIHSGGSTHLSGGWLTGCQQIANTMRSGETNRCLLLTDGQANVGITSGEELAMHAKQIRIRGISTSCFGLGLGFNERLLEGMANEGGGKFYYIERAKDIPAVLALELGELTAMVATDVKIHVQLPAGASAEVPAGWHTELAGQQLTIHAGDLYAKQEIEFYVRLTTPPFSKVPELVVPVEVETQGGIAKGIVTSSLTFTYADDSVVDQAVLDKEMMSHYARVEVAEAASEALRLEREGLGEIGGEALAERVKANMPFLAENDAQLYLDMGLRIRRGMDEADRKTSHSREYRDRKRFNR